jgi:dihydroxyacetone kinase-like predicted kinase
MNSGAVDDVRRRLCVFFRHLIRLGYSKDTLIQLFAKANENAHKHLRRTPADFKALQDRKLI